MDSPKSPRGLGVKASETNKNVNWLDFPAAWLYYVVLLLLGWLLVSGFTDPGIAWTYVHIVHGIVTYILFHYVKGSPIEDDQGVHDRCRNAVGPGSGGTRPSRHGRLGCQLQEALLHLRAWLAAVFTSISVAGILPDTAAELDPGTLSGTGCRRHGPCA